MFKIQYWKGMKPKPRKQPQVMHLTSPQEPATDYNPYALVEVRIGDQTILARPVEFDSDPIDPAFHNAAGDLIKPVKLSTVCPACGHGIVVVVADGPSACCGNCGLGAVPVAAPVADIDPFCNPLVAGRLAEHDLDPGAPPVVNVETLTPPRTVPVETGGQAARVPHGVPDTPAPSAGDPGLPVVEQESLSVPLEQEPAPRRVEPELDSVTDLGPEPE